MQNNPNQEIHTDYRAYDIFKPVNANQLANAIHYDFVITQEMLDKYLEKHSSATAIDVGNLIASDIDGNDSSWENPVPAPVSIYIAAKTSLDDPFTLVFGGRLCSSTQPIVDCGSQYDTPNAEDLINVYSAYPYRVETLVGGINHWSTPSTRIRLTGDNRQNGIVKIGSYKLDNPTTICRPDNFMLVIQGSSDNGLEFVYPWTLDSASNDNEIPDFGVYRPSVVHTNWMSGGGVSNAYRINGEDFTNPSKIVNGLYAQIEQTIRMGSEPSLDVYHLHSTSRYQFSGWDSSEARFSNLDAGKVVSVHKSGAITWRTAAGAVGGGDGGRVIITDLNPENVPHVKKDGSDRVSESLYSVGWDWEKLLVFRGGETDFLTVPQDTPDGYSWYAPGVNGFDFKGATRLDWYLWYGISDYEYAAGATDPSLQWYFNSHSTMTINTDKLVEGLVYEINIDIVALPIGTYTVGSDASAIVVNNQATPATSFPQGAYPPSIQVMFYDSLSVTQNIRYWGDDKGGHTGWNYGVNIGFHDNNTWSNYPHSTDDWDGVNSKNLDILAKGKLTFVKLQGIVYIMSY